jgi:hypothetical protein
MKTVYASVAGLPVASLRRTGNVKIAAAVVHAAFKILAFIFARSSYSPLPIRDLMLVDAFSATLLVSKVVRCRQPSPARQSISAVSTGH